MLQCEFFKHGVWHVVHGCVVDGDLRSLRQHGVLVSLVKMIKRKSLVCIRAKARNCEIANSHDSSLASTEQRRMAARAFVNKPALEG